MIVWKKLDELFLIKSLSSQIILKMQLFGFKMDAIKSLECNLDKLKKMTIKLIDTGEELFDENKGIILLNSVPDMYRKVKNMLQYGSDCLNINTMVSAHRRRDVKLKQDKIELGRSNKKDNQNGYSLYVKGKKCKKEYGSKKKGRFQSRCSSKPRKLEIKCWTY